jgi:DNA polymerase-1
MSYSNPNLQNIPKEDEPEDLTKPYIVRESFIPRDGYHFVSLDYDQVEYRLMLDYAGEMKVIRRVLEGEDLHQVMADMVGVSRKIAKTLNFAVLYGSGSDNIAKMLGISSSQASELKLQYFGRLPKVSNFISRVKSVGRARGYIVNWMGRRCHLDNRKFAYRLPNHLIQGGAADVIKQAMIVNADYLRRKRSFMTVQIHDDILHEIHNSELDIVPDIKKIMESVYTPKNGMKLTVSPEISKRSWAYRDFEAMVC